MLTTKERKNNYLTGREIIRTQTKFQVKALKTFRGMEGTGVNVNMYQDGKMIGHIIDEGNGGCLWIEYYGLKAVSTVKEEIKYRKKVKKDLIIMLESLSTYTNRDCGWDHDEDKINKWDEESFWNEIITMAIAKRDYKKDMKKVQVIDENGKLCYYNGFRPHELEKPYKTKKGEIKPLHKMIVEDLKCKKVLNMLPEAESFDIWFRIVFACHFGH